MQAGNGPSSISFDRSADIVRPQFFRLEFLREMRDAFAIKDAS